MSSLAVIQQNVARYGLSALLVFGNFGNLFTIVLLSRSAKQKLNSCSLYLLAASISNWIVINTGLLSNIIGVDYIDPQHTSNIICKLRWASIHTLLMLSRSFSKSKHEFIHSLIVENSDLVIAACVDRWALCSDNLRIRSFSRPRQAIRLIAILIVIWTLIPIHMVVFFNNDSGRCRATPGTYALFYAIYSLFVIGLFPLVLMIVFSLWAWNNLRLAHIRVAPVGSRVVRVHKRDRDLLKMLSGEVLVYCITTIPYPINLIYTVSTEPFAALKSPTRKSIESLVGYIVSPLLNFMYCCAQFYGKRNTLARFTRTLNISFLVYAVCSRKFRKDFLGLFHRKPGQNVQSGQISAPGATHPSARY